MFSLLKEEITAIEKDEGLWASIQFGFWNKGLKIIHSNSKCPKRMSFFGKEKDLEKLRRKFAEIGIAIK